MVRQEDKSQIESELLFDLRQAFVIITTEIKKEIVSTSLGNHYSKWYQLLDRLFIEISKNLSDEEIEEYEEIKNKSVKILNEHSSTFLGNSKENVNDVYNALRTLDLWINRKMNEKNMFGLREVDSGTEGL